MSVIQTTVNGNLVWYDGAYPHRWLDALGPNVVKFIENFQQFPIQAANAPAWGLATLVNASTLAPVAGADGGALLITTAGAENDGANIQVYGEAFSFASAWPTYFGIRCKMSEEVQSDLLAGLCITDTDLLGGMTDGLYFRKVDASANVALVLEKNSAETEIANLHTSVDDTWLVLEFTYDGSYVSAYVDGAKVAQVAAENANFPNDEYLTPSLQFLTGAVAAYTCTVDWIRAIQIQA